MNIFGFELPTEIGLPEIDILGLLNGGFDFLKSILPGFMEWIFNICGGNPIIVGIVIGFPIYLCLDFFYHVFLDKPAASVGEAIMSLAMKAVVFVIVFMFVYFMWAMA